VRTRASWDVRCSRRVHKCCDSVDGKVCLSLLNTAPGTSESERWNPSTSNLKQLLLSIQALIFVEDPFFNLPALVRARGSEEGRQLSQTYIRRIRKKTMLYACLDAMEHPSVAFRDVIVRHFRLKGPQLLETYSRWANEDGMDHLLPHLRRLLVPDAMPPVEAGCAPAPGWKCSLCTHENEPTSRFCAQCDEAANFGCDAEISVGASQSCGSVAVAGTSTLASSDEGWTCELCATDNEVSSAVCECCSVPRS